MPQLNRIPRELQVLRQWVCSGPDKVPLTPLTGAKADPSNPKTWGSFEDAVSAGYANIGYCLSLDDPYCIIDLDDAYSKKKKDGSPRYTPEQCDVITLRQNKIREHCETYTERSQSGKGYHLITKGSIPRGRNKDEVEVYSFSRYMICTGDAINSLPITPQQDIIDILYEEMDTLSSVELEDRPSLIDDAALVDMATNAANGDKFDLLCGGEWESTYSSQSEADLALMSIIAYYTKDNAQVRRLFRMSALGEREKATKNDSYLNFNLKRIRANEPPEIDLSAFLDKLPQFPPSAAPRPPRPPSNKPPSNKPPRPPKAGKAQYSFPPGLIGELAAYIFSSAIRPVKEVALVAAIGLFAGICGRSYNISGSGLNQYLVLLARTGTGKEGAATGIDTLVSAVRKKIPIIDDFMGPASFASGQSLIRVLDEHPVFVSILGEFGLTLQQICSAKASSSEIMLKRVLLDLYSKSGWNKTLRSSVYSEKEKNTKIIPSPNVTIIGESTPSTFYEKIDESHIAEGLIPRFSIIEYEGLRPASNENAFHPPEENLIQDFADFATVAISTQNNDTCCPVQIDAVASKLFLLFDKESDKLINSSVNEVIPELWNRAHLKALKLAALVAVGVSHHQPIISNEVATWAIQFVRKDIQGVLQRFNRGEVGTGDHRRDADARRCMENFSSLTAKQRIAYKVPKGLEVSGVVPFSYFRTRLRLLTSFKNDRRGAMRAVEDCLADLVKGEVLKEISLKQAREQFNLNQNLYIRGPLW